MSYWKRANVYFNDSSKKDYIYAIEIYKDIVYKSPYVYSYKLEYSELLSVYSSLLGYKGEDELSLYNIEKSISLIKESMGESDVRLNYIKILMRNLYNLSVFYRGGSDNIERNSDLEYFYLKEAVEIGDKYVNTFTEDKELYYQYIELLVSLGVYLVRNNQVAYGLEYFSKSMRVSVKLIQSNDHGLDKDRVYGFLNFFGEIDWSYSEKEGGERSLINIHENFIKIIGSGSGSGSDGNLVDFYNISYIIARLYYYKRNYMESIHYYNVYLSNSLGVLKFCDKNEERFCQDVKYMVSKVYASLIELYEVVGYSDKKMAVMVDYIKFRERFMGDKFVISGFSLSDFENKKKYLERLQKAIKSIPVVYRFSNGGAPSPIIYGRVYEGFSYSGKFTDSLPYNFKSMVE